MLTTEEWSCEVCREVRPDPVIGVARACRRGSVDGRPFTPYQRNVRYCLDRPACGAGAVARAMAALKPLR